MTLILTLLTTTEPDEHQRWWNNILSAVLIFLELVFFLTLSLFFFTSNLFKSFTFVLVGAEAWGGGAESEQLCRVAGFPERVQNGVAEADPGNKGYVSSSLAPLTPLIASRVLCFVFWKWNRSG